MVNRLKMAWYFKKLGLLMLKKLREKFITCNDHVLQLIVAGNYLHPGNFGAMPADFAIDGSIQK